MKTCKAIITLVLSLVLLTTLLPVTACAQTEYLTLDESIECIDGMILKLPELYKWGVFGKAIGNEFDYYLPQLGTSYNLIANDGRVSMDDVYKVVEDIRRDCTLCVADESDAQKYLEHQLYQYLEANEDWAVSLNMFLYEDGEGDLMVSLANDESGFCASVYLCEDGVYRTSYRALAIVVEQFERQFQRNGW